MQRGSKRLLAFALLVTPALLGAAAFWFLPRSEIPRFEELPPGEYTAVAFATVRDGGPRHHADGTVTLYVENNTAQWLLYFEDYDAPRGRDVWFHLTPSADPSSRDHLEGGVRLSVPGRGPVDVRGTFVVPVPEEVDPTAYDALVAWEHRFNQRHALAQWTPANNTTLDQ